MPGAERARRRTRSWSAWGRLQYEKGFQYLVEAMASLRTAVPGVRCVIAGRGCYLTELKRLAHVLGVADIVQFAGFVPDDELRHCSTGPAASVIPSLYEPFGIVALEALAAGAPVVAAATGGLAEILAGTGRRRCCSSRATPSLRRSPSQRLLTEPGLAARCQRGRPAARWSRSGTPGTPIAAATARRRMNGPDAGPEDYGVRTAPG